MWIFVLYLLIGLGFCLYDLHELCKYVVERLVDDKKEINQSNFCQYLKARFNWSYIVFPILCWPLLALFEIIWRGADAKDWILDRVLGWFLKVLFKKYQNKKETTAPVIFINTVFDKNAPEPTGNAPSVVAPPQEQWPNWPLSEEAKRTIEGAYQHVKPQEVEDK